MYFAFMWMDQWLKIMEAFTAEQARFVQSGAERASLDEITNLRGALADREQALAAAAAALNSQEAVYAELIKKAQEAERRLQIEEREKADMRRELERTRAELDKVRVERASALQSQDRLERTLAEVRLETERERKDAEARLAELHRKLSDAERRWNADRQHTEAAASKKTRGNKKAIRSAPNSTERTVMSKTAQAGSETTEASDLVVYFQKPADWNGRMCVYYWDTEPPTEQPEWPGMPVADAGDGWFVHRFERTRAAHLIFNDDRGHQTGDLYRDQPGWLATDGTWHDGKPEASDS